MSGKHSAGLADEAERGERGPKGDHGQVGDNGAVGVRGPKGEKGDSPKAHWYSLTDNRLLAIFGIVVLTGVLFVHGLSGVVHDLQDAQDDIVANAYKIEHNDYESCLQFNASHNRFNAVIEAAIVKERGKDTPSTARIQQLSDLKLPIQHCVKPKKPKG